MDGPRAELGAVGPAGGLPREIGGDVAADRRQRVGGLRRREGGGDRGVDRVAHLAEDAGRLHDVEPLDRRRERHPALAREVHHRPPVVGIGQVGRDPGVLHLVGRHLAAVDDRGVGHPGAGEGRGDRRGAADAQALFQEIGRQLDDTAHVAGRSAARPQESDEQARLVDVVAAALAERTDRSLHAARIPLGADLVADEFVDRHVVVLERRRTGQDLVVLRRLRGAREIGG